MAPGDKLRISRSMRFLYTGGVPREWLPAATVALIQRDQQSSVRLEALVRGDINRIWLAHGLSRYLIAPLDNNGAAIPFDDPCPVHGHYNRGSAVISGGNDTCSRGIRFLEIEGRRNYG